MGTLEVRRLRGGQGDIRNSPRCGIFGAVGALLEACGARWKLVERPRGSWSALLEAQACGALRWRHLERAKSSWSALEAMVMEAR